MKHANARQSRAVKELGWRHRIALSGTPIENRLSDLWSLFHFLCPGLLGGAREFVAFLKSRSPGDPNLFAPLRRLVRPYILRRLKTDKQVIADLPDKTEMTAFCPLSCRTYVSLACPWIGSFPKLRTSLIQPASGPTFRKCRLRLPSWLRRIVFS